MAINSSLKDADEQVNVVGNATDALREAAETGNRTTQIFVQPRTPRRRDNRFAVFCPKQKLVHPFMGISQ